MNTPVIGPLVSTAEASKILGISQRKLGQLVFDCEIPSVKIGRCRRFDIRDLDAWVETRKSIAAQTGFDIAKLVSEATDAGISLGIDGDDLTIGLSDESSQIQEGWFSLLQAVESRVVAYLRKRGDS